MWFVSGEKSLSADAVHICGVCLMNVFVRYEGKMKRELRPRSDTSDARFCRRRLRVTHVYQTVTPPPHVHMLNAGERAEWMIK